VNLNHDYFSRIIYQKGAIENLSGILKQAKTTKKVYFISSKTPYQMFGVFVVNEFNLAQKEFIFQLIDSNFSYEDATISAQKAQKCEFVVCLGGGSVVDFAKIVANISGAKLITIVSSVATTAPFSSTSFIKKNSIIEKINCKVAEKIIIDEDLIKNCNQNVVQSGINYILSFWDLVFNLETNALLFGLRCDTSGLKTILAKLNDHYLENNLVDPLLIMDMQIDLGYFLKDIDQENMVAFFLSLLLKNSSAIKKVDFGKLCLLSSQILQACYEKYFSLKKVDTYNYLDLQALSVAVNSLRIHPQHISFSNIKQIRTNKQLFLKINAVKNQVISLIEKSKYKLGLTQGPKIQTFYDFNKCVCAFSVLPYVYKCSAFTNVLFSSGLIVC
jgi:hypothetical protein